MITWHSKSFDALNTRELLAALSLRAEVFVVEQGDCYCDPDKLDLNAVHILGYDSDQQLIAYGRVILPQADQPRLKLGRVVVAASHRGLALGKALLKEMLAWIAESDYRHVPLVLNAQQHLTAFYQGFGFIPQGSPYKIGPIMHIDMYRDPLVLNT